MVAHLLVAAAIVSAPAAHLEEPFLSAGTGAALWPSAINCLLIGSSVALPALGLMWLVDRGGTGRLLPWLAPLGAWMAGMLALQLHCPILAHEHQWAGHFGVLVPVSLLWLVLWRLRPVD